MDPIKVIDGDDDDESMIVELNPLASSPGGSDEMRDLGLPSPSSAVTNLEDSLGGKLKIESPVRNGPKPASELMERRFSVIASGSNNKVQDTPVPVVRVPPPVSCPEKIIICLDMSQEMDDEVDMPFKLADGSTHSPFTMARRVIEMFVQSKCSIDKRHEYALVLLYDLPVWAKDFTNEPNDICSILGRLESKQCSKMNFSILLEQIESKIEMPVVSEPDLIPPPYVVRMIFIYGRSSCIPEISTKKEALKRLFQTNYFFLDVFYIHKTPTDDNKCQDTFDMLCDLDECGTSYIVEVTRNPTKLYDSMAQLLAHPLQRPIQRDASYRLA